MSRIAKKPVQIPSGVDVTVNGQNINVKGAKGSISFDTHPSVNVVNEENALKFSPRDGKTNAQAMAGTVRALVENIVTGVSKGFEKRLQLVGVGYRAQVQGKKLNLSLGFSHPVEYAIPEGINIETPSQTEVIVTGIDKQRVGQVCANIRAYRPPEPYKGKGVKYADERIIRKEAKKK
ncbi:MAG: 50S ribosomal protein L6 [Thiohalomonadales bacterium]